MALRSCLLALKGCRLAVRSCLLALKGCRLALKRCDGGDLPRGELCWARAGDLRGDEL